MISMVYINIIVYKHIYGCVCVCLCVCVCGGVVCNFLDHVSVQQKFEAAGQC